MKRARRWTSAASRDWEGFRIRSNPRSNARWNRTRGFRSAFQDGVAVGMPLFEIPLDVFDGNRSVVHKNADGEGQSSEGHDVDGFSEKAEGHDGGQDGQRNGDGDDQRTAPTSQEEQNHQTCETRGDDGLADDAVDGASDEDGLIGQRQNLKFRGEGLRDTGKKAPNAFHDADCRSVAGLEHGHQRAATTILTHDVGLRCKSVAHIRYITKIDRGIPNDLNREVI